MEHRVAGVRAMSLHGLNTGTLDLSDYGWWHKVTIRTSHTVNDYQMDGFETCIVFKL